MCSSFLPPRSVEMEFFFRGEGTCVDMKRSTCSVIEYGLDEIEYPLQSFSIQRGPSTLLFQLGRTIGSGSFGNVLSYHCGDTWLCIKYTLRGLDADEYDFLQTIRPSYPFEHMPTRCVSISSLLQGIVMPLYDGSISNLHIPSRQVMHTIADINLQIELLYIRYGYYFTDVKKENIVYYKTQGQLFVALCDIGSTLPHQLRDLDSHEAIVDNIKQKIVQIGNALVDTKNQTKKNTHTHTIAFHDTTHWNSKYNIVIFFTSRRGPLIGRFL